VPSIGSTIHTRRARSRSGSSSVSSESQPIAPDGSRNRSCRNSLTAMSVSDTGE
jgi:hypothetical protein